MTRHLRMRAALAGSCISTHCHCCFLSTGHSTKRNNAGWQEQQQSGNSIETTSTSVQTISLSSSLRISAVAFLTLVMIPLWLWKGRPEPLPHWMSLWRHVEIAWDSLLHVRLGPLVAMSWIRAVLLARQAATLQPSSSFSQTVHPPPTGFFYLPSRLRPCSLTLWRNVVYIVLGFFVTSIIISQLQIIAPSSVWNPFSLGLKVYYPHDIAHNLQGLCLEQTEPTLQKAAAATTTTTTTTSDALCLSKRSWKELSAGALDPTNRQHVETVRRGIQYIRDESGGLIINVMSRDTVDAIVPLRQNVEGLLPFVPTGKLAVVVFENDSVDGSREAFQQWANEPDKGYHVDVMSCGPENPDCKFHVSHRYESAEAENYFMSSAVGRMPEFRQKMVNYILQSSTYQNYSHMLVLDLDLKVTISPLGVLHTLGSVTDAAVASSGRQVWPGSMGTLIPPYDFAPYRAIRTPANQHLMALSQRFCEIMPPGDRWRNQCDTVSPMHLMLILTNDRFHPHELYPVASAYNGATLYPLALIRQTHAKYDSGDDGQRCEHVGFHLSLQKPMYINPLWTFYLSPDNPGGPKGYPALRNVIRIIFTPRISLVIGAQVMASMLLFVYCVMLLGLYGVYPLLLLFLAATVGRHQANATRELWLSTAVGGGRNETKGMTLPLWVRSYMFQPSDKRHT